MAQTQQVCLLTILTSAKQPCRSTGSRTSSSSSNRQRVCSRNSSRRHSSSYSKGHSNKTLRGTLGWCLNCAQHVQACMSPSS